MLVELAVHDLGVIESLSAVLGPGMTAITGETGAGKTLVVGAIELLTGGRADASLVRPGAEEAVVEGRFVVDGDEVVARRVVPRTGRSRAYLQGRLCTAQELSAATRPLVDLHGQHEHQSLLGSDEQRTALDRWAGVDRERLETARDAVRRARAVLDGLGGDERLRLRTLDLLRFQVEEIEAAGIDGPDEDDRLDAEEDQLAGAVEHREAAARALAALADDGAARDRLAEAASALRDRAPLRGPGDRLDSLLAELDDAVGELRSVAETIEDDPERLASIRARRQLLRDLQRKHGEGLAAVLDALSSARAELAELEGRDAAREAAVEDLAAAEVACDAVEAEVGEARRAAAPGLASAVTGRLEVLAMAGARVEVEVGPGAGDDVRFVLAANAGQPAAPLARAASGGELARTMLALRLVLTQGPPLLVFDEVDAGVGGQAAEAVGAALAGVAEQHQVLVVTHLPQVAAAADAQLRLVKQDDGGTTRTTLEALDAEGRVVELSRMLAGRPDSDAARSHARELLAGRGSADPAGR